MASQDWHADRDWLWNFDVDRYTNRITPQSPVNLLPWPLARLLGGGEKRPDVCRLAVWSWACFGGFCGIALVEAVYRYSSLIPVSNPPVIIGSFGAAAILEYNTIASPLAQPRNMFFGQFLSATVGVCIAKLFELSPNGGFEELRWVGGALAVGLSSFIMGITNTIHPPAGATALLAVTSEDVNNLGWFLLPTVIVGNCLMLGSACLINNIQRQFPAYWWTPADLKPKPPPAREFDVESGKTEIDGGAAAQHILEKQSSPMSISEIKISSRDIVTPDGIQLSRTERNLLLELQRRLGGGSEDGLEDD